MEKLLMQVALIDQVTKPLQGISNQVTKTAETGRQGFEKMAGGTVGLVAAGVAVQTALMPAIEMDRKLGEVKSLGVTDESLKQLQQTALEFSAGYGKSATDFVAASYDIQSAIAGLDGNELSQFTKASGVLAAATKADTSTITSYMGTMYGIFKNQAEEMGKGEWVEQVAGMTASAVQMFKTTGNEMSAAFTSVGANATSAGIAMSEQMAILGTLQATMSGSEAGTKYKAFLAGVGTAQDKLNLKFTDTQGNMLPMLDILDKLKGKFGDTLEVAESDALKAAFGSDEAVSLIKLLMADTQGLTGSIEALGQVKGMTKAEEMAAAMTDQWERLEASWFAVRASVFGMVLPSINAVVGSLADGMMVLTGWVNEFPILGEILGYGAIAFLSLSGVVATWAVASGFATVATVALGGAFAFLTSPITLVIAALAGVTAAVVYFWDYISVFLGGFISGFVEASGVAELFQPLVTIFEAISYVVGIVASSIMQFFGTMDEGTKSLSGFAAAGELVGQIIGAVFKGILFPIKLVLSGIEWLIEKLNLLPGVEIDIGSKFDESQLDTAIQASSNTAVTHKMTEDMPSVIQYKRPENIDLPPSGVGYQLGNNTTNQKTSHYGDVHIHTQQAMTPDQLAEWDELNAG
nr:phage tail tape measure protein [Photobacterium halotolerans]